MQLAHGSDVVDHCRTVPTGLFFHELKYWLPDDYCAVSYSEAGIGRSTAGIRIAEALCKKLLGSELKAVGAGYSLIAFERTTDDPYGSACLMTFFGRVSVQCMTLQKALATKRQYRLNDRAIVSM